MSSYTPPNLNKLPFKFSSAGYSKPTFDKVSFNFKPTSAGLSSLSAAVKVLQLYQDKTFTYKKDCKNVVIGYSSNGIQILRLVCSYAGIRDLGAQIYAELEHYDLNAYLRAVSNFADLYTYIIGGFTGILDLNAFIKSYYKSYSNLNATLLGNYIERDLDAFINIISIKDLPANITSQLWKSSSDLKAYLKTFQIKAIDFRAYLNIIQISNFSASIDPELWHGYKDLSLYVKGFFREYKDFNITLHSWGTIDLGAIIDQVYFKDLNARILSTLHLDLSAYLYGIKPVDLKSFLHGFDKKDLTAFLIGGYGPTDLITYLNCIGPIDLSAAISGYLGLNEINNLNAYVSSFINKDLNASIFAGNVLNLNGYLYATGGYKNLRARLIPKIIHVKKDFNICLLSLKNLSALINTSCFNTGVTNLTASLYSYNSKALSAYLMVGTAQGGDLNASINNSNILEEDFIDIVYTTYPAFVNMELDIISKTAGLTFDTLDIRYTLVPHNTSSLKAYLYATRFSKDNYNLKATLHCVLNKAYTSKLVSDDTETHFGVYKLNKSRLDWRREIEIVFNSQAKKYRYVEGSQHAYREIKSNHWVIRIEGFNYISGIGVEKGKVRHRYLFNLSKYNTIDEAIRDAINRVATLRKISLPASVVGIISKSPFYDLKGRVHVKRLFKAYVDFNIILKSFSKNNIINLKASAIGHLPIYDLNAFIEGDLYAPPKGNKVDFNFDQKDILPDTGNLVNLTFEVGV